MQFSQAVYGNRFRTKRFAKFMAIVDAVIAEKGSCRIADIGGRAESWLALSDLWRTRNITVTIIDLFPQDLKVDDPRFSVIQANACSMPEIGDNSFDVVFSNSVIEHVGTWDAQRKFAHEVARIAPRHFVQTPNFWFAFEPHFRTPFIHWLPEPVRAWIVQARKCGFYKKAASVDEAMEILGDARLLSASTMRSLFPDSEIYREKLLLMTKSVVAMK